MFSSKPVNDDPLSIRQLDREQRRYRVRAIDPVNRQKWCALLLLISKKADPTIAANYRSLAPHTQSHQADDAGMSGAICVNKSTGLTTSYARLPSVSPVAVSQTNHPLGSIEFRKFVT
jgi:hypothetical protein